MRGGREQVRGRESGLVCEPRISKETPAHEKKKKKKQKLQEAEGMLKTSEELGVQQHVIERNVLVKVIDRLTDERQLAPKVWEAIENGLLITASDEETQTNSEAFFTARILRIEKSDKEWIAHFLIAASLHRACAATSTAPMRTASSKPFVARKP